MDTKGLLLLLLVSLLFFVGAQSKSFGLDSDDSDEEYSLDDTPGGEGYDFLFVDPIDDWDNEDDSDDSLEVEAKLLSRSIPKLEEEKLLPAVEKTEDFPTDSDEELEDDDDDKEPSAEATLPELYNQLMDFFDQGQIDDFIDRKNRTDPDAAQLLWDVEKYLEGSAAKAIVAGFWSDLEFQDAIFYLYENGLTGVYTKINEFHEKYGYEPVGPPTSKLTALKSAETLNQKTQGVQGSGDNSVLKVSSRSPGLVQEFLDSLQLERVRLFFHDNKDSEVLRKLYERFASKAFGEHYREYKKMPELAALGVSITGAGFEYDSFKKIVEVCMTWENHSSVGLVWSPHSSPVKEHKLV